MKHDDTTRVELTEIQQRWLAHLEAAQRSESSLRRYAEAHGLRAQALYDWKQRFKRKGVWPVESEGLTFKRAEVVDLTSAATVVTPEPPTPAGLDCRICLPNGVVVEIGGSGPGSLCEVLQAAGAWS